MEQKQTKKTDKLKLRATLREKRHYLVLKILSKKSLDKKEIKKIIDRSILNFIGILGYACAGPIYVRIFEKEIKDNKEKTYFVLLSVLTKYVDYIKAALTLIEEPQIKCIGVSGTIKKSQRFLK